MEGSEKGEHGISNTSLNESDNSLFYEPITLSNSASYFDLTGRYKAEELFLMTELNSFEAKDFFPEIIALDGQENDSFDSLTCYNANISETCVQSEPLVSGEPSEANETSIMKQFNLIAKKYKSNSSNQSGSGTLSRMNRNATSTESNSNISSDITDNLMPDYLHIRMHSDEVSDINSSNKETSEASESQRTHSVLRSRSAAGALVDANIPRNRKLVLTDNKSSGVSPNQECAGSSTSLGSIELHNQNEQVPFQGNTSDSSLTNSDIPETVKTMLAKRYHIIRELILVEKEYLKCLSTMVNGYMIPLKHDKILEETSVDTIFYKIHELMMYHVSFLNRLQTWDTTNTVGDKILEMFSRETVADCYCSFIENFSVSEKALETCMNTKTTFQRFCDNKAKEFRKRLPLKALLVQPAQRIPRYELLIKRLIEYTPKELPDYNLVLEAEGAIHNLALRINTVKDIKQDEAIIEGEHFLNKLLSPVSLTPMRQYIQHDIVSVAERKGCVCIFMFTDQLVLTVMKRKNSQSIRKPQILRLKTISGYDVVENIKYKVYQRFGLENIEFEEITESELELLTQNKELRDKKDMMLLAEIEHISSKLEHKHQSLDLIIRRMYQSIQKDLEDLHNIRVTSPGNQMDYTSKFSVTTKEGTDKYDITFATSEKRQNWETRVKVQKKQLCAIPRTPKWSEAIEIPKTLSGMKLSCAAPTETGIHLTSIVPKDVWICTSDGFTGHLCLLKLHPKAIVSSHVPLSGCNSPVNVIFPVPGFFAKIESKNKQASPSCTARNSPERPSSKKSSEKLSDFGGEEQGDDNDCSSNSSDNSDVENSDEFPSSPVCDEQPVVKVTVSSDCVNDNSNCSSKCHKGRPLDRTKKLIDPHRATMWLGTEEGTILIYYASDNVRITRNRQKLTLPSSVYDINYIDSKVFVSCSDGDIYFYQRNSSNCWNFEDGNKFRINIEKDEITGVSVQQLNPNHSYAGHAVVRKMLSVIGSIWCASKRDIFIVNPNTQLVERSFQLPSNQGDFHSISNMVYGHQCVWISTVNTTKIYLYHAISANFILELDLRVTIMQKLANYDEIIQKHKEACLRLTCMTVCKDLLWVGTSAGIIIVIVIPKINSNSDKSNTPLPKITTLDKGHTGNVRFLITLESALDHAAGLQGLKQGLKGMSTKSGDTEERSSFSMSSSNVSSRRVSINPCTTMATLMRVISGGDGIEDFLPKSDPNVNVQLGDLDSVNHLLFWDVH